MDRTADGVSFETGDKVRLLRDYPGYKRGRRGTFIQYSGEFAVIQLGKAQISVWPYDLEKVPVRKVKEELVMGQPIKNFQTGLSCRLVSATPTDEADIVLQPKQLIVVVAQSKEFTLVHPLDDEWNYFIDTETPVFPMEEP